ncbi:MAG: hypothetical protein JXM68_06525, partial [Sedimentisphaerales bacterium]|nr:hypothetical protein [Sedimentisphaerales bacterium]
MESELSPKHIIIVAPVEVQRQLSAQLDMCRALTEVCDNVYLATAMVFKHKRAGTCKTNALLLLVWLDNLSRSQMGFFKLIAESGFGQSVALSGHSQEKLQQALESGACHALLLSSFNGSVINGIYDKVGIIKGNSPAADEVDHVLSAQRQVELIIEKEKGSGKVKESMSVFDKEEISL